MGQALSGVIPVILFTIAALIRLAAIWFWHFDGLYGQDAFAYYQQALAIAERLPQGSPPPTDFFWPNGYPLLAALWMGLLGRDEYAAQLVTLFCGAALAPLAYALSRELFPSIGHRVGLWAGVIVAVAGQPVLSSVVIMADVPALFWATLASWLLVRAWGTSMQQKSVQQKSEVDSHLVGSTLDVLDRVPDGSKVGANWTYQGFLLAAGVVLGLAVVTRWAYALLALPFAVYALVQTQKYKTSRWVLLLPTLGGLAVLLPQIGLSLNRSESLLHVWLLNWRFSNAFGRQFAHIDGDYSYALPVGIYYLQPLAHPNYMVPVFGLAALWGTWHLWRKQTWAPLILLGGWAGTVYLFLAGIPYENFRFGLTLYLPLVLLVGVGVEALRLQPPPWVMRKLERWIDRTRWERGVYLVAAVSLLTMALWAIRSADRFLSAQNTTKETAREIQSLLPTGATVLSFGLTLTLQHYTDLNVVELYNLDEEGLEAATSVSAPIYLLLDLENVAHQWQSRPPQINYRWLQEHRTLTPVRNFPPYSLFQVTATELQVTATDHASFRFDPNSSSRRAASYLLDGRCLWARQICVMNPWMTQ